MFHRLLALALLSLTLPVLAPSALLAGQDPLPPSPLVQRFLDRQDAPLVSFRAIRRLEAANERFKKAGWMEVEVEVSPERGFTYEVRAEGGSGYIRDKVLRKALEGEADALRREPSRAALTRANYELVAAETAEPGLAAIRILPRRKDVFLVDGVVTVQADDADLVSVEGRLAKSPSFWTRRVQVVRRYGRVQGVRVPVAMESTADVRLAGRSTFRMVSTYLQVNGTDVATVASR